MCESIFQPVQSDSCLFLPIFLLIKRVCAGVHECTCACVLSVSALRMNNILLVLLPLSRDAIQQCPILMDRPLSVLVCVLVCYKDCERVRVNEYANISLESLFTLFVNMYTSLTRYKPAEEENSNSSVHPLFRS